MRRTWSAAVTMLMAVGGIGACAGAPTESDSTVQRPVPEPAPAPKAAPTIERKTVTDIRKIRFQTKTVKDPSVVEGIRTVRTRGVPGKRKLVYRVTSTDGVRTGKRLLRTKVVREPVSKVIVIGTKPERQCDSNYGGCVPIASDVDCAGGSGDGPAYVSGPVEIIGSDIYDLDSDSDGIGCEPS